MADPAIDTNPTPGARELVAKVPVVEVTLLEDRGLVRRRGRVTLPAGRSFVVVEGVAPVLVDKTLAAEVHAPEGGTRPDGVRARDVKIERRWVTRDADRPTEVADLAARIREREAERDALQHRLTVARDHAQSIGELARLTVEEVSEDAAWGRLPAGPVEGDLDRFDTELLGQGRAICELEHELRTTERDLADLHTLLAARSSLDSHAAATLRVELVNPGPEPADVQLVVDYLVPGAMWRPWHTAALTETDDGASVLLRTDGCVWQATGEDWTDVALTFSTERPSLGVAPPELETDELRVRKRGTAVQVQTRDQQVHTAGLGADASATPAAVEDELPGIDDGGDALELRGRARATVPTDGRPHRVPIDERELPARLDWVCTPELVAAVMLRSRQTHAGDRPLLAGPVDLVRHGGLVGRTSVLFVAPGERFDLGWGPDRALRVHREEEHLAHERKTLSSWSRRPRRVTIKLSNLGAAPRTIEVTERIAVSEVEKVEVELQHASRGGTRDDDGFVRWTVDLRGFGRDELDLRWTLVVHDDVVGL